MKKRKLLTTIFTGLCACLTCATLFTACNEKHTHTYAMQVTTEATCTEKGAITYTCSCGDILMEEIPAFGHDTKAHDGKEATCAEKGWKAYETCTRCDYTTYEEIPATGEHTWDEGVITKQPTITEHGEKTHTCTICKTATKTEKIAKLEEPWTDENVDNEGWN